MALTNNGLISSQVSGRTLTINPATSFANGATGTLEAKSGGILDHCADGHLDQCGDDQRERGDGEPRAARSTPPAASAPGATRAAR